MGKLERKEKVVLQNVTVIPFDGNMDGLGIPETMNLQMTAWQISGVPGR